MGGWNNCFWYAALFVKKCLIYEKRKETIELVFAGAKDKHAMRYTHMRGLTCATQWVRLKAAPHNSRLTA